jgi:3-dehydroquinate dehydratase
MKGKSFVVCNDEDDFDFEIHSNANTPVAFYVEDTSQKSSSSSNESISKNENQLLRYYSNNLRQAHFKPAILASVGTAARSTMHVRSKPSKRLPASITRQKVNQVRSEQEDYTAAKLKRLLASDASEADIQQLKLEEEVKELIDEAKELSATSDSSKQPSARRIPLATLNTKNKSSIERRNGSLGDKLIPTASAVNNNNEKLLQKSVESLIVSIKSGELAKEQDESNKRITNILSSVLDKQSLSMLDIDIDFSKQEETIEIDKEETEQTNQEQV